MRGACVVDRRGRAEVEDDQPPVKKARVEPSEVEDLEGDDQVEYKVGDEGGWLGEGGNQINVCVDTNCKDEFGEIMIRRIFGMETE